jgi:hypothetical protein
MIDNIEAKQQSEQTDSPPKSQPRFTIDKELTSQEVNLYIANSKNEAERLRTALLQFSVGTLWFCPYVYRNSDTSYLISISTEFGNKTPLHAIEKINEFVLEFMMQESESK